MSAEDQAEMRGSTIAVGEKSGKLRNHGLACLDGQEKKGQTDIQPGGPGLRSTTSKVRGDE